VVISKPRLVYVRLKKNFFNKVICHRYFSKYFCHYHFLLFLTNCHPIVYWWQFNKFLSEFVGHCQLSTSFSNRDRRPFKLFQQQPKNYRGATTTTTTTATTTTIQYFINGLLLCLDCYCNLILFISHKISTRKVFEV
jgi:hypothetical protein